MPAAFRAAGRLPAAGFGANFKPSHLIRGRRALSPSSPSALEFVMATPESPRPPIVMSRLDYDRIEALIESANDRGVDTTALEAEITRADVVEPAHMPRDVITMTSTARFLAENSVQEHKLTLVYPRNTTAQHGSGTYPPHDRRAPPG